MDHLLSFKRHSRPQQSATTNSSSINMSATQTYQTTTQPTMVKQEHDSVPVQAPVREKKVYKDPYYGQEETAKMSARFIISLFNCPIIPPQTIPNAPQPSLAHFIAYSLHRTRLPHFVTLSGLLLLSRLKARYPSARGSSGHRLFISAFMIASKVVCDDTYSNQSWAIVAQKMFSLKEMNQMEREMCGYLEWNLNPSAAEVDAFEAKLKAEHSTLAYNAKKAAIRAQSQAQMEAQQQFFAREQGYVPSSTSTSTSTINQTAQPSNGVQTPLASASRPTSAGMDMQRITAGLPSRNSYSKNWNARSGSPAMTPISGSAASGSSRGRTPPAMSISKRPSSSRSQSGIPLSSSINFTSNGHVACPTASSSSIPTFHPGSTGPVGAALPSLNARRSSKANVMAAVGKDKLSTASRSSSGWSLNLMNPASASSSTAGFERHPVHVHQQVAGQGSHAGAYFRTGAEVARSSRSTASGKRMALDRYKGEGEVDDDDDEDNYEEIEDEGHIPALSTTWPRTSGAHPEQYLRPPSKPRRSDRSTETLGTNTTVSSPYSSASHLHNSPHPSLTNDSSNQSSPDSQPCQTPSPIAQPAKSAHQVARAMSIDRQGSKPVPIREHRASVAWW